MRIRSFLASLLVLAAFGSANAQTYKDPDNTLLLQLKDGTVAIELRPDLAPVHVARVKELARAKFYDGQIFHRVIEGFMAQTGDPTGTGRGGSGKTLPDEFSTAHFVRGTVGAASSGPNTSDSQFFICFKPASFLDNQYTIWGQVVAGMEFVDKIARGEPPANPDKIISVRVAADVASNANSASVTTPAPAPIAAKQ